MSVIHVPGSSDSLGDLSRKLAAAFGRTWQLITFGECDEWHAFSAKLIAALRDRDRGNPSRGGLN